MNNAKEKARSVRTGEGSQPEVRAEESAADIEKLSPEGSKEPCQPASRFALDALREIAARAKAHG